MRDPFRQTWGIGRELRRMACSLRQGAGNLWTATYWCGSSKACTQTPTAQPTTSKDNAAGIRLYSMWPCFRHPLDWGATCADTRKRVEQSHHRTDGQLRQRETCSNTSLISLCCSYYQLQLCIGLPSMVFGEVKQSTIYAKFGESSCKYVFIKQKTTPWLTDLYDVINIASQPAPGGGRLCSYATANSPPSICDAAQRELQLLKQGCHEKEVTKFQKPYIQDKRTPT